MRHGKTDIARIPLMAIGDLHGDGLPFLRYLLANRLVAADDDGGVNWTGGDTVLVQTGDIADRGPHTVAIAETIMGLRAQGAQIITLLGNHDVPYLLADDDLEQRRRFRQAVSYMIDEQGRGAAQMPDAAAEYLAQAQALTALHDHRLAGLLAIRLGTVLFMHVEPNPLAFEDDELAMLAGHGRVFYDQQRHRVDHPVFWGRAYSWGTADAEGGYPPDGDHIPGSHEYARGILAQHERQPKVQRLYERFHDAGITTIVHGHVPGATVRQYQVCGITHVNIDEAISAAYRSQYLPPDERDRHENFVPRGWRAD